MNSTRKVVDKILTEEEDNWIDSYAHDNVMQRLLANHSEAGGQIAQAFFKAFKLKYPKLTQSQIEVLYRSKLPRYTLDQVETDARNLIQVRVDPKLISLIKSNLPDNPAPYLSNEN